MNTIEQIIKDLDLQPHPEGGYFKETYRSVGEINQDEAWHFYKGSPAKIHIISETGEYSNVTVGQNFSRGEKPQFVVPGHHWFAEKVENDNDYTLVGCTVSPGFDFKDFILPTRLELISKYPQHQDLIKEFTHEQQN